MKQLPIILKPFCLAGASLLPIITFGASKDANKTAQQMPNIIYIMADDLGIGDLGCYGQRQIKTPAIDKLAANGVKFTQHYSGSTVSAPSRCVLMTGKHTGNACIRGNIDYKGADGRMYDHPLKDEEVTVAEVLKQKKYKTACIGKWGMGGPDSQGHPNKQGFDYFYGYLGQLNAHRYYPDQLFENSTPILLNKQVYSHDLIMGKALNFIEANAEKPFFLYLTPTIPHADLIVPNGEYMGYDGLFYEKPYTGGSYTAQPKPRATFAAMVSRLDRDVQRLIDLLKEKGILDNTIVVFTSDNGTHQEGGHDPYFFDSNGSFRGTKRDLYEGGVRTPFIVQWPAKIPEGSVSYHVSAFWDFLPTVCDLAGVDIPKEVNGISYLPTLTQKGEQSVHDYLYFEFHEGGGKQAVIEGPWKLIRLQVNSPEKSYYELYNIHTDPGEIANVAALYPDRVEQMKKKIAAGHSLNPYWRFVFEKK